LKAAVRKPLAATPDVATTRLRHTQPVKNSRLVNARLLNVREQFWIPGLVVLMWIPGLLSILMRLILKSGFEDVRFIFGRPCAILDH
jgi:hypothetical protein